MITESDGSGGWYLTGVDHLNASVHITSEWLDDMAEHQPPNSGFYRLRNLIESGSTDASRIGGAYSDAMTGFATKRDQDPRRPKDEAFYDWIRGNRANR